MNIAYSTLVKIKKILTYFEVGNFYDYGAVSLYRDGKNNTWQVTYGLLQTTQQGNLPKLLTTYAKANGIYSTPIGVYSPYTSSNLYRDEAFLTYLRLAGSDPVMKRVQDDFFDDQYLCNAEKWAEQNGFTLPLSYLVIADSFIHSGSIRKDIRDTFPEYPPQLGGDEKRWIKQYCEARKLWLKTRRLAALKLTVYRPNCFLDAIDKNNWELSLPINANGREI